MRRRCGGNRHRKGQRTQGKHGPVGGAGHPFIGGDANNVVYHVPLRFGTGRVEIYGIKLAVNCGAIWESLGPSQGIFWRLVGRSAACQSGQIASRIGASRGGLRYMDLKREVGRSVGDWTPPPAPDASVLEGTYARLERLDSTAHAADLHAANQADGRIWDYLGYGPFATESAYRLWADGMAGQTDPYFYAIVDRATGKAGGVASYLRITPAAGSIEVGHINLAPVLQGSRIATEAMFLMMAWAFAAGYRRYEWKCDALNLPSRRAADREPQGRGGYRVVRGD